MSLANWRGARLPPRQESLLGAYCQVVAPVTREMAGVLFRSFECLDALNDSFFFMPHGPFAGEDAFVDFLCASSNDVRYAVLVGGRCVGVASLIRAVPEHGVIEVACVLYSPALRRTAPATECQLLLMRLVFEELGYRRYEWKTDSLNTPSRSAALRLGFKFEGIFRQHMVIKHRNRDTAWFSLTDSEYRELVGPAITRWLAEGVAEDGKQIVPLAMFMAGGC
eukprot:gnl/Spiro4/25101_TR12493_c0_g1_i1.p1 gnl/Spiro4/25101_TR12493_c0_g1~~gnl/Spiro4/25101_TR12493_c0_g1_i1.p1  ORF type:complete len:238 (-),score=43.83 gnl/Spiro4/25101_TR12493_c0_g1_i1:66-734(-)